jgi:hypothetical protein
MDGITKGQISSQISLVYIDTFVKMVQVSVKQSSEVSVSVPLFNAVDDSVESLHNSNNC